MITSIYAAYRGDRYVGEGTLSELAKLLGVKRQTLVWARYPAARKRVEKTEANPKARIRTAGAGTLARHVRARLQRPDVAGRL